MSKRNSILIALQAISLLIIVFAISGCSRLRIPQIDPTGNRIFLPAPNTTEILTPNITRTSPRIPGQGNLPVQPAFGRAAEPAPCCGPFAPSANRPRHIIPKPTRYPTRGQSGEIIMSPSRIIAPVGSEVVVTAGICGGDSYFVMNQPLEWILSTNSAGQFIEVGGMEHSTFNRLVRPSAKKFNGNYAWGRTGLKNKLLTRGTPTPADDIELVKGQAYVSLSSASEGTSYVTCVAPKAQAWDKRRKSTVIHWIDALWAIPVPKTATAGTVTPLTTVVSRNTDDGGVEGWKVRYSIVGGAPAEFAPTGSQSAEVTTNSDGEATVQIRQVAGQFDPGTTQVRVDVIRPKLFGEAELQVESGITSVNWSAPALSIRAIGPKAAGINESFNYRLEVTNPGDQVTRDVVVKTTDFPDTLEFISSSPKPTVFGRELQWELGTIAPGSEPQVIDIQLKSNTKGNNELCFDVSSETDQLQTQACAQTEIAVPCLGLQINGPNAGQVGEQSKFNIVVANQCDEPLENIELQIQYDPGLRATGLGNPIRSNIGRLEPGGQRVIPIVFDIIDSGRHCYNLSVTADGGHSARATECVEASPSAASLVDVKVEGQRRVNRGDDVLVRTTVTNNGNVPQDNVTLNNRFSSSIEPSRVTELYEHRWLGTNSDELIFNLGRLDPGQSKVVEIFYGALEEDGDAFSEVTVSAPNLSPITRKFDMRVELPGTIGSGDTVPPSDIEPGAAEPPVRETPPIQPENPIGIPDDDDAQNLNARRDLQITARALDRQTQVGGRSRTEFVLTNVSTIADRNIALSVLLPTSLQLVDVLDDVGNAYNIVGRSQDFTRFDIEPRKEIRAGDTLTFIVIVDAVQPGQAFVELQATSDNSAGRITASDSVVISQ